VCENELVDCDSSHDNPTISNNITANVAIIGGGMSGTAFAHYAKKLMPNIKLTIFEATDRLGGRVQSLDVVDGNATIKIEVGGSIFVKVNYKMEELIQEFKLKKVRRDETWKRENDAKGKYIDGQFGIFDGNQYLFKASSWSLLTFLKILYRYGLSPFSVQSIVNETLDKFMKLYENDFGSFESINELFEKLNLLNETQITLNDYLASKGVAQIYIDEIASVATRANYGQDTTNISAFAGLITLVALNLKSWQLNEGNDILASKMVQASKAKVFFNSPIHSIDLFIDKTIDSEQLNNEKENNGIWQTLKNVVLGDNNDNNNESNNDKMDENQTDDLKKRKIYSIQNQKFDAVVIATPLELSANSYDSKLPSNIKLKLPVQAATKSKTYWTTHTTLISAEKIISNSIDSDLDVSLSNINAGDKPFTTLSRLYACENGTNIYKIFSRQKLTNQLLTNLFGVKFSILFEKPWKAYTDLSPKNENLWSPIRLGEKIYDLSAMESVVSTIETQLVSASNVAKLLEKDLLSE